MSSIEAVAFWGSIIGYSVATVLVFASVAFKRRNLMVASVRAALTTAVIHATTIAVRWWEAGHFPYIASYENVLVGTFAMVVAYLLVATGRRGLGYAGILVLPVTLLTLGYGLTQAVGVQPVTPPYQSAWLVVHVTFAWITYATYSVVAGLAVVLLVRLRDDGSGIGRTFAEWLPASSEIDGLSLKLVAFGFLNNAVMIVSGSIWAYRLWGSYWRWDPVETWSLLTWLAYALYLHAHTTLGWRGRRLAWLALFALFGVLMTFWGVQVVPNTYHLFREIGNAGLELSRPR